MKRRENKEIRFVHKRKNFQCLGLFTFLLLLLIISTAFAQGIGKSKKALLYERFRGIVKEMEEAYDNGDLNRIIELYNKNCRKSKNAKPGEEKKEFKKLKKEFRADIYQWVALSYIALDRPEMGDIFLRRLLVLRRDEGIGEYWLFIRNIAKNKYYVAPRWLIGLKGGTNFTMAHPGNRYTIIKPAAETEWNSYDKDYVFNFAYSRGMQAAVIVEYALTKDLSVCIQPAIGSIKFQYKNNFEWEGENSTESKTVKFTHNQRLKYIEIPAILKYRFLKSKLKAYLQIGGFYRITTAAYKSIDVNVGESGFPSEAGAKGVNIKNQITRFDIGFLIGSAVGFDTRRLRLEIEVNYKHSLRNIVNGDQRYENNELVFGYYDVFDDIKVRNWELSFNILLPVSFKTFRR